MRSFFRLLLIAFLLGFAISCALLALLLISMLDRFSKDINEIMAVWQYEGILIISVSLALAAVFRLRRVHLPPKDV